MIIVEIECYKGDVLLYGSNIKECDLKKQFVEIENSYDRNEDNFIELFCRRFGWSILETSGEPDFTYDRDISLLFRLGI